ncbi:uncharacterized protein F5891DRAFT_926173, partial [Suillus fuscotomentosus]
SISMYLALEHSSQDAYNRICRATTRNFESAEGIDEMLSFYAIEKFIAKYTGVESVEHDMSLQSCLAFISPYSNDSTCSLC